MADDRSPRHPFAGTICATVLGAVLAAGCGEPAPDDGDRPGLPEGTDAIVIQFDTRDTDPPAPPVLQARLSAVPEVTAYASGRVVVASGHTGQLSQLREVMVARSELAGLLAQADDAGLLTGDLPDTGDPVRTHPAVTLVRLGTADATYEFAVFDLGSDFPGDLSIEQVRTRDAVARLRSRLLALVGNGTEPYVPDGLAVYVLLSGPPAPGPAAAWPLDRVPDQGGEVVPGVDGWRCLHLTGEEEVAAVTDAARAAQGTSTTWSSAGRAWTLAIRPLLPHEHACPQP